MDQEIKQKWVQALRSGDYEQGMGTLCKDGKYCCLGVLGEVLDLPKEKNEYGRTYYNGNSTYLYLTDGGEFLNLPLVKQVPLADMNDSGRYTFNDIADYIEENL